MAEIQNITSHTFGAMERICILGAQEDKHRDGESRTCHQPTESSHTHSPSQPWPAAPRPANSPLAKGNLHYRLCFGNLLDKLEI